MGCVTVTASVLRRGRCHADRHEQASTNRASVSAHAEPLRGRLSARSLIPVRDPAPASVSVSVSVCVCVSVCVSGGSCGP